MNKRDITDIRGGRVKNTPSQVCGDANGGLVNVKGAFKGATDNVNSFPNAAQMVAW